MATFLHIGFTKTGSTAAQREFAENREALLARGVHYPGESFKHGCVAFAAASPHSNRPNAARNWAQLREEIAAVRAETVLLSEETLCRASARRLHKVIKLVRGAGNRPINGIVYVRHPLEHAVSYAQQTLRGGTARLQDVSTQPIVYDLTERVAAFASAFRRRGLIVRPFDRDQLVGGNTQSDLLAAIGVTDASFLTGRTYNESLSMPAALAMDAVRARLPRPGSQPERARVKRVLRRLLEIPGPRFALPRATLDRLAPEAERSVAWLREEHGIVLPPARVTAREDLAELWSPEAEAALREALATLEVPVEPEAILERAG